MPSGVRRKGGGQPAGAFAPYLSGKPQNLRQECPPTLRRCSVVRTSDLQVRRHLRHLRPSGRPTLLTSDLRPSGQYHVRTLQGSSDEDLLSCPVRALRIYLRRTNTARGKRRRLLLPINPANNKVRDITANTVSSWVKKTIVQAYSQSGSLLEDEYIRKLYGVNTQESANFHRAAHEVRAQSTSYKFDSTHHSLEAIMRMCYWRSSSVFTHFYLRDITLEDREHLHRLSTCAAPGYKDARCP